jgi:protein-tyrosine phosphatase
LAGPLPRGDRELLVEAGVTVFVDLRLEIEDLGCPTRETMTRILDSIDASLAAGEVVYVHCLAGIGRTGTVIGCYLVRHGMSGDEALATVERLRGAGPETPEQRQLVRSFGSS